MPNGIIFCSGSDYLRHKYYLSLNQRGIKTIATEISTFRDGEIYCRINCNNLEDFKNIYIVQSFHSHISGKESNINEAIFELILTIHAIMQSNLCTQKIQLLLPYFPYSRQDRAIKKHELISFTAIQSIFSSLGINSLITCDVHNLNTFNLMYRNLTPADMLEDIKSFIDYYRNSQNLAIVSPDFGAAKKVKVIAEILDLPLIVIDKRRDENRQSSVFEIYGNTYNKSCLIIDDIVDGCNTLINASQILLEKGATNVKAFVTHSILSGNAIDKLENSNITQLMTTDSINILSRLENSYKTSQYTSKITQIPIFDKLLNLCSI